MFEIPSGFTESDERAVSPVIGVILMVAITVILAAVVASFVLGFGNSIQSNAQAGVTVDDGNVTVTSLGSETDGVYCTSGTATSPGSSSTDLAGVGTTIAGCSGGNVVAVINEGGSVATETVVRTGV